MTTKQMLTKIMERLDAIEARLKVIEENGIIRITPKPFPPIDVYGPPTIWREGYDSTIDDPNIRVPRIECSGRQN